MEVKAGRDGSAVWARVCKSESGKWTFLRDNQAGRLSMVGRGVGLGSVRRECCGSTAAEGGGCGLDGGRRWTGKVALSWRARKVLERQSRRPCTAWQKGQPRIVLTAMSSPRAMDRWTGEPSENV